MRVYLAGPINGTTDKQAHQWRDTVKAALQGRDVQFVDPMVRDYRGKETENVAAIVEGDQADILSCDLLFAYCWTPSYGTAMEIQFAHQWDVETWAIVEGKAPSPWIAYHARVFASLGDAVLELARRSA